MTDALLAGVNVTELHNNGTQAALLLALARCLEALQDKGTSAQYFCRAALALSCLGASGWADSALAAARATADDSSGVLLSSVEAVHCARHGAPMPNDNLFPTLWDVQGAHTVWRDTVEYALAELEWRRGHPHLALQHAKKAAGQRSEWAALSSPDSQALALAHPAGAMAFAQSLLQVARLLHALGQVEDAHTYLERALTCAEKLGCGLAADCVRLALCRLYADQRRFPEAEAVLQAAKATAAAGSPLGCLQLCRAQAWLCLQQGRCEEGVRILSGAIDRAAELRAGLLPLRGLVVAEEGISDASSWRLWDAIVARLVTERLWASHLAGGRLAPGAVDVQPLPLVWQPPERTEGLLWQARMHLMGDLVGVNTVWCLASGAMAALDGDPIHNLAGQLARVSLQQHDASEEEPPSSEALHQLRVPDLKALLKEKGLPTAGRKQDLVERLLAASQAGGPAPVDGTSLRSEPLRVDGGVTRAREALDLATQHAQCDLDVQLARRMHGLLAVCLGYRDVRRALYHHHLALGRMVRLEKAALAQAPMVDPSRDEFEAWVANLPSGVAVCGLACPDRGQEALGFTISRLDCRRRALARVGGDAAEPAHALAAQMQELRDRTTATIKLPASTNEEKGEWWRQRRGLDKEVQEFTLTLERNLLGAWRGMVLGDLVCPKAAIILQEEVRSQRVYL